jgi:hypothetical protein
MGEALVTWSPTRRIWVRVAVDSCILRAEALVWMKGGRENGLDGLWRSGPLK